MKVVVQPKEEEEVLAPVEPEASAEEIREGIVSKAQCCVDHLCGCSKCC